jgi:methionyl-tRNA formyltransferase
MKRTVFVGAVEGSLVAFEALVAAGKCPAAVVTLPARLATRHSDFVDLASPAKRHGCEVLEVSNVNSPEAIAAICRLKPDLCLVIGWSQICGKDFRSLARLGNIGFHPAPLPRLRGRAVIPWTILLGERESASTLFWLDDGVDSGDILLQRGFAVDAAETAATLYSKHTANLAAMIPDAVTMVEEGTAPRMPQDESKATYCAKRNPEDGLIDWTQPADAVLTLVRAVGKPYPGAFTISDGRKLTIDEAVLYGPPGRYVGLTGQVQAHAEGGFVVRCGDGRCVLVRSWRSESPRLPKVHGRLEWRR